MSPLSRVVSLPELDGYKTSVHEIDGHSSMNQELPAHEGHWGRHELISEVSLPEHGGREVALAATRQDASR